MPRKLNFSEKPDPKKVYTTGEVAKLCGFSQQTVIRAFEDGHIKGYVVGSGEHKHRRIPEDSLVAFMKASGIPLDGLKLTPKQIEKANSKDSIVTLTEDGFGKKLRSLLQRLRPPVEVAVAEGSFDACYKMGTGNHKAVVVQGLGAEIDARDIRETLDSNKNKNPVILVGEKAFPKAKIVRVRQGEVITAIAKALGRRKL